MLDKTKGVVLHSIQYNDKYSIIYMYTEHFGRVSYLVPKTRGRKSAVPHALFMPLSVLEMEVEHKNNRELHRIKEARSSFPVSELSCNPVKGVLALFLAEVLYRVVKETEPDKKIFDFISQSVYLLELSENGIANFHLVFLLRLLHYLGIFPNVDSYRTGSYFDMLNSVFVNSLPMHKHYLNIRETEVFSCLLRISYENMHKYAFSRSERVFIVNKIMEYYRLHMPEFPEIKSISVMQAIFN